jgi:hypothetical protein
MLLFVHKCRTVFLDNQRCRQQHLFLQADMGVHPVRAGACVCKAIVFGFTRFQNRPRQPRHPVLRQRRRQAVPVDQGFHVSGIGQPRCKIATKSRPQTT